MSFNSSVLSEKTVKSFVDRLLRRYKNHSNTGLHGIKRATVQEDVAAMLGHASWHALITQIKDPLVPTIPCDGLIVSDLLNKMSFFEERERLRFFNNEKEKSLAWEDVSQHFFVRGLEHARSQWYRELLTSNPDRPVLLVQGPLSHNLVWSGLSLHNNAITSQAFFLQRSAGALTEFLVRIMIMDEDNGDSAMWKGRAISLISSVMLALAHLRDHNGLLISGDVICDNLILDNIITLSKHGNLPQNVVQSLNAYLRALPGYQENAPKQSSTAAEQHGYLQMQFTRILPLLEDQPKNVLQKTRLKLSFDAHVDVAYPIIEVVRHWSVTYPNSLVIFDGLEHTSPLYHLVLQALPLLYDHKVALAIGSTSQADLPDDINAQKRLSSRIGNQVNVHLV